MIFWNMLQATFFVVIGMIGTCTAMLWAYLLGWRGPYQREIARRRPGRYLTRWSLREQSPKAGAWRAYLHQFHGPDDEGHHNHPWRWSFSIVLGGSYTEEYFDALPGIEVMGAGAARQQHQIRRRRVRFFNWIPAHRYHRIDELHGNVWTLFFTGPFTGLSWGFWLNGRGHVQWKVRQAELDAAKAAK